jgi:hypothetical protein
MLLLQIATMCIVESFFVNTSKNAVLLHMYFKKAHIPTPPPKNCYMLQNMEDTYYKTKILFQILVVV